ncbi:neuraminidase-like domain-containing protein [Streptomyces sp. NBC_01594]|uniref:Tc toxin subunit A-related protein n=1 Tax=Streptomyces sp. NBC_01594 TaxID=2975890 RepID=UPI00386A5144
MHPIDPPVMRASSSDDVANLQDGLQFLLDLGEFGVTVDDYRCLVEGLQQERGEYGPTTRGLVRLFQERAALPEVSGEVDRPTADALSGRLSQLHAYREDTTPEWVVRGQVVGDSGPVDRALVVALDRDLFFGRDGEDRGQLLGQAVTGPHPTTGEAGWFEIGYGTEQFASGDLPTDGELVPDLVFTVTCDNERQERFTVVRVPDGEMLTAEHVVTADEAVLGIAARRVETLRLMLDGATAERGPSEYERVWRALAQLMPSHVLAGGRADSDSGADDAGREAAVCEAAARLDEEGHRDITFAARETGLDDDVLETFAGSCRLSKELPEAVPTAVFYGLARAGRLVDLRGLGAAGLAMLDAGLRRAIGENIIPALGEGLLAAAVQTIYRLAPVQVLDQPTSGERASLREVLSLAVQDEGQQLELLQLAADFEGSHAEFTESLHGHEGLQDQAERIAFVTQLGSLTRDNVPMMRALETTTGATSMRALAFALEPEIVRGLASDPAVTVPADLPGDSDTARRRHYADGVLGLLRNAYPTVLVARKIGELADEGADSVVTMHAARFLKEVALSREDFNLATSRITDFADHIGGSEKEREAALRDVLRVQRLFRISTSEGNLEGLLRSGFSSSFDITRKLTLEGFVAGHQQALGGEAETALTYRRAAAVSAANMMMALHVHQLGADVTPYAVSGGMKEVPSWAQLFGTASGCECGQCRSWLSPAAYFVDLLLFLDKKHAADQTKTPLEVLLARRPDLGHLKLSCENTDTTLPYIDLVNEVLESYAFSDGVPDASAAHDVTDETAQELRDSPRNVQESAYRQLARATYPPSLPFDRALEISRAYLGQLGVARHELLAAFEGSYADADTEAAKRRESLAESLGISAREHEIITGHDFSGTPRWVELVELFGSAEGGTAVGTDVPSFLDRAQLRFADLVELLTCRFIGPAQALYERLEAVHGEFEVTSKELRAFIDAGYAADAQLTAKLAGVNRTPDQLKVRLESEFPPERMAELIVLHSEQGRDCDPAGMRMQNLDGTALGGGELRRIAVFLRLWRKLRWTMPELDTALLAFGAAEDGASPDLLTELARLKRLRQTSDADLPTLLSLWGALDTRGPTSPYHRLFQNRSVQNPIDGDFQLRPGGDELLTMDEPETDRRRLQDKVPMILAALRVSEDELRSITAEAVRCGDLDSSPDRRWLRLGNLSVLHRYVLLARLHDLSITDLITLLRLAGTDPFTGPQATLDFGELVGSVRQSGLSIAQLNYLYGEPAPGPESIAPTGQELGATAAELRSAWAEVTREYTANAEVTTEQLQTKLAMLLDPTTLPLAMSLIEGRPGNGGIPYGGQLQKMRTQFTERYPSSRELAQAAAGAVFPPPVTLGNTEEDEETRSSRRLAAFKALLPLLHNVLGHSRVQQTLQHALGLDADVLRVLLEETEVLGGIDNSEQPAVQDFLPKVTTVAPDGPPDPSSAFYTSLSRLHKIALLARTLSLGVDELRHFARHGDDFGGFDLRAFATSPDPSGFAAFGRLAAYAALRNRLTPGPVRLLDVLTAPAAQRVAALIAATHWDDVMVRDALAACDKTAEDLRDERALLTLEHVAQLARRVGVLPSTLKAWGVQSPSTSSSEPHSQQQVQAIVDAVKAKYDHDSWLEVTRAINDPLRERQRDALVAHVSTLIGARSQEELFEHFLIDVAMSACMLTSRIKQAISSVQLFVQRCLLNLESDATPDAIDSEQWQWRKNYRVWEANRKIFLYPENWIEPELRDDKSPFFAELESELLQADVNTDTVERGMLAYLRKAEAVANLEVCGFHMQNENDTSVLHVFGRTRTGVPRGYYYRRLLGGKEWTPWEPVPVDIQGVEKEDTDSQSGVHLLPVVWRGKLHLFWPQFVKRNRKSQAVGTTARADGMPLEEPVSYWEVKLAWSRYEHGTWTPKQVSSDLVEWPSTSAARPVRALGKGRRREFTLDDAAGDRMRILLRSRIESDSLRIDMLMRTVDTWVYPFDTHAFEVVFPDSTAAPTFVQSLDIVRRPLNVGTGRFQRQWFRDTLRLVSMEKRMYPPVPILGTCPTSYWVTPAAQHDLPPLDSLMFYQDDHHGYLVLLSEDHETVWPQIVSPPPAESRPEVTLPQLIDPGFRIPQLNLPRPPEFSVHGSPWRAAMHTLLPSAIQRAATTAGLRTTVLKAGFKAMDMAGVVSPVRAPRQVADAMLNAMTRDISDLVVGGLITRPDTRPTVNARFVTFFHPQMSTFAHRLQRHGLPGLLSLESQSLSDDAEFAQTYQPVGERVAGPYPQHGVDFTPGGAYSIYNWELFFHVPVLLATRLSRHQRFAEAQRWFHYVFDPTDNSPQAGTGRFWKMKPLRDATSESLADLFAKVTPGQANTPEEQEVVDQLEILAEHPFQPHRIARMRQTAYQKFVVMKYLDNLISWGDQLYSRDTIESVNEATQLYVLAARLLGTRPERITRSGRTEPQSFFQLRPRLDEAGNALAELENRLPFASMLGPAPSSAGMSVLLGTGTAPYFCIPQNDKLLGYWDLVDDRLFKIRHCMNIEGMVRQLPLFEPPIDPALLVRAAAAGIDVADAVADVGAPLPRYRFQVALQNALEICNEVRAFGAALLAALEKKDGEALAAVRAQHESALLKAVTMAKDWQIAEADATVAALRASRDAAIHQLFHYGRLLGEQAPSVPEEPKVPESPQARPGVGITPLYAPTGRFELTDGGKIIVSGAAFGAAAGSLIAGPMGAAAGAAIGGATGDIEVASAQSGAKILTYEQDELFQSFLATTHTMAGAVAEGIAPLFHLIPQFELALKPLGIGGGAAFGGMALGAGASAVAKVLDAVGKWHSFRSSLAQKLAGVVWREQDHAFQRNSAVMQIAQIDREMITAQIRRALNDADRTSHGTQIEQAAEVERFLREKYTNQELYGWMERETGSLFFRAFQLAQDLAKQAERSYRFELGITDSTPETSFVIGTGSWDSLHKGLLAGERLGLALRQMERAYQERNRREYEITRHISLLQLDPESLIRLRATGACEFEVPETLFDLDFPGHYFRRIKSVGVSVPCVVGPYTGVTGTLTLLNNRVRVKSLVSAGAGAAGGEAGGYAEQTQGGDPRFLRDYVPLQSIATSGAQSDSGMFELSFRDERYLPFEGAGAISRWRFALPDEFRQFDYDTISDLVLHLHYTARDAGAMLRSSAVGELKKTFSGDGAAPGAPAALKRMVSLRHEFPDAWHRFLRTPAGVDRKLTVNISKQRFPYFTTRGDVTVTRLSLLSPGDGAGIQDMRITFTDTSSGQPLAPPLVLRTSGQAVHPALTEFQPDSPLSLQVRDSETDTWEVTVAPAQAADIDGLTDLVLLCEYRFRLAESR